LRRLVSPRWRFGYRRYTRSIGPEFSDLAQKVRAPPRQPRRTCRPLPPITSEALSRSRLVAGPLARAIRHIEAGGGLVQGVVQLGRQLRNTMFAGRQPLVPYASGSTAAGSSRSVAALASRNRPTWQKVRKLRHDWHEKQVKTLKPRPWGQISGGQSSTDTGGISIRRRGDGFLTSLASAPFRISGSCEGSPSCRAVLTRQLQALRFRCTTPRKPPDPAQRNRRYYFVRLHQGSRGR
jgi:hypothetical protein